jgi:5,10-methylenetetrahydrofolate reductase
MEPFSKILQGDEFVITCELNPPKGTDLSGLLHKAETLAGHVHGFNITESAAARMACDPVAVAHQLVQRGIEAIVQMTSRDKNRIALQSGMLGAAVLGIRNLVFMGGDPPRIGDHPDAKPVFDLYASQLVKCATALNNGHDLMGNALRGTPEFTIGSVFNPGAANIGTELDNTRRKIDGGARFLQTQAIYDAGSLETFLGKLNRNDIPVLAGIIPIKSTRMARYMNEHVPGIDISAALIERVAAVEARGEDVTQVSLDIATNTIRQIRPLCRGLHIMAIGWEEKIPALLDRI